MNRIVQTIMALLGREVPGQGLRAQTPGGPATSETGAGPEDGVGSVSATEAPCPDADRAGMPTCQQINEFLTNYLEGELDSETRARFESHVALCPPCHGYFDQYRQTMELAHACRDSDLPPDLVEHTLEFLREHRTP